jgi:predicted nucleic acid-binding protein
MPYLVDTNVLGRLANKSDAQHGVALHAAIELHRRGEILNLTPQVLIEFRSIATREIAQNGLGFSAVDTEASAAGFETAFPLVVDTPDIYPAWKGLVASLGIIGKQVHDARLVAVCHAHGITHLLTFNVADFGRMAQFGPGLVIVDPASI